LLVFSGKDDTDFAKPVGIPKASSKRVPSTGSVGRKPSFQGGAKTTGNILI
jgi:hypothetical protein